MKVSFRAVAAAILTFFLVGLIGSEVIHAGFISDPCAQECHAADSSTKEDKAKSVCDCLCHMAASALTQRIADLRSSPLVPTSYLSTGHLHAPDGPIAEILLPPQLA